MGKVEGNQRKIELPNLEQQQEGINEKDTHTRNHFDGIDSLHSATD
jgi:hypothetical protein